MRKGSRQKFKAQAQREIVLQSIFTDPAIQFALASKSFLIVVEGRSDTMISTDLQFTKISITFLGFKTEDKSVVLTKILLRVSYFSYLLAEALLRTERHITELLMLMFRYLKK